MCVKQQCSQHCALFKDIWGPDGWVVMPLDLKFQQWQTLSFTYVPNSILLPKRQTHDTGVETDLKQECRSGTHRHINKLRVQAWTQHGEASQWPACTWHWAPGLAPGPSPLSCQGADGLCDLLATRQIHNMNLGTQSCKRFWRYGAHPPISGQWAEGDSALPWASQCHGTRLCRAFPRCGHHRYKMIKTRSLNSSSPGGRQRTALQRHRAQASLVRW